MTEIIPHDASLPSLLPVIQQPIVHMDRVQMVIDTLRKPEIRTPFSEVLRSSAQQYFGEVMNQENPPELIRKLNDQHGTVLLSGSTLRGTARTVTSDLDVVILYDSDGHTSIEKYDEHKIESILTSPEYHPENVSFSVWLARHLKSDPNLKHYYDQRRDAIIAQYRKAWGDDWQIMVRKKWERIGKEDFKQKSDLEIVDHEIEQGFIISEAQTVDMHKLAKATRKIAEIPPDQFNITSVNMSIRDSQDREGYLLLDHYMYDMKVALPELLTSTDEFAFSHDSEALLHHQQKAVKLLLDLRQNNKVVFEQVYARLEQSFFQRDVVYEGGSHGTGSKYYRKLEENYVINSGRFSADKSGRAARLVRFVKRQTVFPSLDDMEKHYFDTSASAVTDQNARSELSNLA